MVKFTAKVTSPATGKIPAGPVIFKASGTTLGTGDLDPNGTATLSTSALAAGKYDIQAVYVGSRDFLGSSVLQKYMGKEVVWPN
jgi:hypothetical protein